jgi:hypothetical protein
MLARMFRLTPGFSGFVFAILLMLCFSAPQPAAGMQVPVPGPARPALASTSLITTYLPLIVRNCTTSLLGNFSNPASGWPRGAEPYANYTYDKGVYKMAFNPDFADFNGGVGASPDWTVSNDAVISVDAWSSVVGGGAGGGWSLGLVTGKVPTTGTNGTCFPCSMISPIIWTNGMPMSMKVITLS